MPSSYAVGWPKMIVSRLEEFKSVASLKVGGAGPIWGSDQQYDLEDGCER